MCHGVAWCTTGARRHARRATPPRQRVPCDTTRAAARSSPAACRRGSRTRRSPRPRALARGSRRACRAEGTMGAWASQRIRQEWASQRLKAQPRHRAGPDRSRGSRRGACRVDEALVASKGQWWRLKRGVGVSPATPSRREKLSARRARASRWRVAGARRGQRIGRLRRLTRAERRHDGRVYAVWCVAREGGGASLATVTWQPHDSYEPLRVGEREQLRVVGQPLDHLRTVPHDGYTSVTRPQPAAPRSSATP